MTATTTSNGNESTAQACDQDYRLALRQYRERLGPARSADEAIDRLVLDFLVANPDDMASGALRRRYRAARERWPNDIGLSWLAFDQCGDECDRAVEVRHLLSVDPDNAAAWMVAMAAARQAHDESGFAHALQRAASAKIYDPQTGIVFLHARSQLARVAIPNSCRTPRELASLRQSVRRAPTDDDLRDLMAQSLEIAIAMPGFLGLSGCAPHDAPLPDTLRQPCTALLSRVAQGDTLAEQVIATNFLLKLETDPSRLAQWRERYRQLQWLQSVGLGKPIPEHYATRMWSQGEVATMLATAMQRGLWPPPPDWLPDDPHRRALITGVDPPQPGTPSHL